MKRVLAVAALVPACTMVVDFGRRGPGTAPPPDSGALRDTATTRTGRLPEPGASVVGDPGDAAGAGGLWWVDGGARLAVGVPERGAVVLFDVGALRPETPISDAAAELRADPEASAGAAFAVADQALVVGGPGEQEVWLLARDAAGTVDLDEGSLAAAELDDDDDESKGGGGEEDTAFGAAVAVGDADGDGLDDLAIGDPEAATGAGTTVRAPVQEILLAGSWAPAGAPVRVHGTGAAALGSAVALGHLDDSGLASLVTCGVDRCWVVPGGLAVSDLDVDAVASARIDAPGAGAVPPRIGDVDGDGRPELVVPGSQAVWVHRDPAGTVAPGDAAAAIAGPVAALGLEAGAGVVLGAPDLDAVYRVLAPSGPSDVPADVDQAWAGAAGTAYGAAVSDLVGASPGLLAVAAPGAAGGAGEVLLVDLSP